MKGKRKLGLQPVPMHDIALHLHKAEERGEDLPIAITLGNDPIITLMGATPLKYDQSEYEMAGALRESPYPIATAPLTGFDVPWGSEVILEGVIESRKREIEGPFGEFTGHYSGGRNMTVVRIDKVSYRTKPIFESTLMGATPLKYDQSEYEMAGALRESPYPIATAPLTGFDVPWGSEVILEGVIESRKREIEGPFGEFTGHYSGGRNMTVVRIDKVSYRTKPIFESLYLGMPWTEIDYLMGPATCVPLYQQLKAEFPEVQAVNAMYTHGLLAIISTKKRYGGFARAVGLRAMTTPHGLGYVKMVIMVDEDVDPFSTKKRYGGFARAVGLRAMTTPHGLGYVKMVIMVDEDVDPFNLPQVMWALSSKVNPAGDLVQLPNMSVLELDPGSSPAGITDKLIIDATTPVAPDNRGHYSQPVCDLPETKAWAEKLTAMLANRK